MEDKETCREINAFENIGGFPKIIHYCWFGGGEMPEELKEYIASWKKILPEWEHKLWNEQNFDISNSIPYVQQAYRLKKYAFVSDYVRLCALRDYGGVYLDTDVEIRKSFEPLLNIGEEELVTGFETRNNLITAFIASKPDNQIISEFVESYEGRLFEKENDEMDLTPINDRFTELMQKYGLIPKSSEQILCNGRVHIYPYEYFAGYDMENSHPKVTANTYTIHHFQSSWKKMDFKTWFKYKVVVAAIQKVIGYDRYDKVKEKLHL